MRARDFPYFRPRFAAFAHRGGDIGGADAPPENSIAAFRAAFDLGYTHAETDVQVTKDGVLVAFHDPFLDRATDGHGLVEQLPWSEVSQARIDGREPIPTLDELLETWPDRCFNIDLKADAAVAPLARVIARHAAQDRVCVASFKSQRLRAFRRQAGALVATAVHPAGIAWFAYGWGVRRAGLPGGQALQIPCLEPRTGLRLLTPGLLTAAHRAGRVVQVWTINDPDEMVRLIELGVDGLVSDNIVVLKELLVERGLWEAA